MLPVVVRWRRGWAAGAHEVARIGERYGVHAPQVVTGGNQQLALLSLGRLAKHCERNSPVNPRVTMNGRPRADVRVVFCLTAREISVRRFTERFEHRQRHWCFEDEQRLERLRAGEPDVAWERAKKLSLDLPSLVVDTTDASAPEVDGILAFVRDPQKQAEPARRSQRIVTSQPKSI